MGNVLFWCRLEMLASLRLATISCCVNFHHLCCIRVTVLLIALNYIGGFSAALPQMPKPLLKRTRDWQGVECCLLPARRPARLGSPDLASPAEELGLRLIHHILLHLLLLTFFMVRFGFHFHFAALRARCVCVCVCVCVWWRSFPNTVNDLKL